MRTISLTQPITTPEYTWSLISPTPIYVEGSNPHLYWWKGIGLSEPMLLCLISKYCFHIAPTPKVRDIAIRSQHEAEKNYCFEGQDTFEGDLPSEMHFHKIDLIFARKERKSYQVAEVLNWIKKRNNQ